MKRFEDVYHRQVLLTDERRSHIETEHPEMSGQIDKIQETLLRPEQIVRSRTDPEIELFYHYYDNTPVSKKYLCIVVKVSKDTQFIITAYFTNTIKRGELLWQKK